MRFQAVNQMAGFRYLRIEISLVGYQVSESV